MTERFARGSGRPLVTKQKSMDDVLSELQGNAMFLSFGKRSADTGRRVCECITLEPSEMVVVSRRNVLPARLLCSPRPRMACERICITACSVAVSVALKVRKYFAASCAQECLRIRSCERGPSEMPSLRGPESPKRLTSKGPLLCLGALRVSQKLRMGRLRRDAECARERRVERRRCVILQSCRLSLLRGSGLKICTRLPRPRGVLCAAVRLVYTPGA
ncbi:hypothetical protein MRX96_016122 [Rhipicephalus microplus]